jgi:mono/diheme cytochrome c family protein
VSDFIATRSSRLRLGWLLLGVAWAGPASAGPTPAADRAPRASQAAGFQDRVAPLLAKYCAGCHGSRKPKAGLDLAALADEPGADRALKVWQRVLDQLEAGDMPPPDRPRPSAEEVARITHWVEATLSQAGCGGPGDPGRVTLRRLNRAEYNNTIRDLVGIDFHPADDFPSDDVGYGFDNIGDVLTLSPLLMEKYLAAAEAITERAIVADGPSAGPLRRWEAKDLETAGGSSFGGTGRMLASSGEIGVSYEAPRDGDYLLRARAFGQQAGLEPARMAFKLDGKTLRTVDVPASEGDSGLYEVRLRAGKGRKKIAVAFVNDYYQPTDPDPKKRGDRNLVVEAIEVQGPAEAEDRPLPATHTRILFRTPTKETKVECARELLARFAGRAFRRPATDEEVERLVAFVTRAEQDGDRFERGIQLAVQAILISPQFLFRVELDPTGEASEAARPLNDYELAARLSYFLWSSMPDEELFGLARQGTLHADATLEAQARRMLEDPKARALVEDFAGQWLQIRNLKTVTPDRTRFPAFDEPLRAAMLQETELFFETIVREDRGILDLLDADDTFLNERLARHYGIAGVKGDQFRRVTLKDHRRGGVLTQASVLTVTSNPTRTSPVKRGKWILEQILGAPPPPPPPDVPELKDETQRAESLRQRMEQHRANPSCASCHARMDPLGFGLENYDAVGAWRDRDDSFPIDASGTLPSGQSFRGPGQLKEILKARRAEFARCLTEKLLTYALGRGLDLQDRCVVDRIVTDLARQQYRFSRLVLGIVRSDPFRKRKVETQP